MSSSSRSSVEPQSSSSSFSSSLPSRRDSNCSQDQSKKDASKSSMPNSPTSLPELSTSPSRRGAIQSVILTHQDVDTYLKKNLAIHSAPTSPPVNNTVSQSSSLTSSPVPASPFLSTVSSAPVSRRKSVAINFGNKDLLSAMQESEDPEDLAFLQNQILAKKAEVETTMQKGRFSSSGSIFRRSRNGDEKDKEKDKKKEKKPKEEKKDKKEKKEKEKKTKKEKKSVSISTDEFFPVRRGSTPEKIIPALRGMGQKSSSIADLHNASKFFTDSSSSLTSSKDEFSENFSDSNIQLEILPLSPNSRNSRDELINFVPRTRERSSTTDSVDPESRARLAGLGFLSPPLERANSGKNIHAKWNSNRSSSGSESDGLAKNAAPRIPTSFSPKGARLSNSNDDVRERSSLTQSVPVTPRKLSASEAPSILASTGRRMMVNSSSSAAPSKYLPPNRKSITEEGKRSISFDRRHHVSALTNLLALRPQTEAINTKKTAKPTGFESEVCEHHLVISKVTDYLLQHATKVEGIFRISGSQQRVNEMKKNYARKGELDLEQEDINNAASFLKMSARNALNPIIPHRLRPFFMKSKDLEDEDNLCVSYLRGLLVRLPSQNYKVLEKIFVLCGQIYENSEITRMSIENLATTIGPSIMPSKGSGLGVEALSDSSTVVDVFTFMIKHHLLLFDKAAKTIFGVAVTLEDFVPEKSNELKFSKGDEIVIFDKMSDHYYYGFHYTSKKFGYVVASKIILPQEMKLQEELLSENSKLSWKAGSDSSSSLSTPTMSRSESLASPNSDVMILSEISIAENE